MSISKKALSILGVCLALATLQADTELNIPGYALVWNDEFEGSAVDSSKWDVNVGINAWYQRASDNRYVEPHWFNEPFEPWLQVGTINDERQYYTPDNVSVQSGKLEIKADFETVTNPIGYYNPNYHRYTSGKLNSADEFQFRFGIVKWRAQLPAGQGMWPALWMLNAPNPWYWDDEIDVMEARGSQPTITTSAHHFKVGPDNANSYNYGNLDTGQNLQQTFNEYGLEWTSSRIHTWINDQTVFVDEVAIPQGPMFLIMNAAVGGMFDGVPADNGIFPAYFRIDWVRVWQPADNPTDLLSGGFEEFQGHQWANWNTTDDGNLSNVSGSALHGSNSIKLSPRTTVPIQESSANLLTDGTSGTWSGWLNEYGPDNSRAIDPAAIPAVTGNDSLTLSVYSTQASTTANAVVYRQIEGANATGKDLRFSGTVAIEETFQNGAEATAFIRIFNQDYSHVDAAETITAGGNFEINVTIPGSNIPFIQVGIETTGTPGSPGRLTATNLLLEDQAAQPPQPADATTRFSQTVVATSQQSIQYGLIVANDSSDPLSEMVTGQLRLEFIDANEQPLGELITEIANANSPFSAIPIVKSAITPENTAFIRLHIERVHADPQSDTSGSFLADAVFLIESNQTNLPIFTLEPSRNVVVQNGQTAVLEVATSSASSATHQWYHNGQPVSTGETLSFSASENSAGTYFVVASNANGQIVGAVSELIVLDDGADTDQDQISDSDETSRFGTNPFLADSDGDGLNDFEELFISETNPLDSMRSLAIRHIQRDSESVSLTFDSVAGLQYELQTSTDLSNWTTLIESISAQSESTTTDIPSPVAEDPIRFFRISVIP